ncbi:hypothetical protein [Streptomyces sp. G45]|uniref:hypothetical protein n=1 Tax=Streptomyces sp. G45 TaxID=3406627 RepID=UPI003C226EC4
MTAWTALDSDELRFREVRWKLTRIPLGDSVLYYDDLSDVARLLASIGLAAVGDDGLGEVVSWEAGGHDTWV